MAGAGNFQKPFNSAKSFHSRKRLPFGFCVSLARHTSPTRLNLIEFQIAVRLTLLSATAIPPSPDRRKLLFCRLLACMMTTSGMMHVQELNLIQLASAKPSSLDLIIGFKIEIAFMAFRPLLPDRGDGANKKLFINLRQADRQVEDLQIDRLGISVSFHFSKVFICRSHSDTCEERNDSRVVIIISLSQGSSNSPLSSPHQKSHVTKHTKKIDDEKRATRGEKKKIKRN